MDGSKTLRDPGESSIALRKSWNGASDGHMSREDSQRTKGEHSDLSVLSSGRKQQDAVEHYATHGGTSDGGAQFKMYDIRSLRNAIKLQKLYEVSYIDVNGGELGSKELSALVAVLASDEMCALFHLSCDGFKDDQSKAIIDALNSRKFPTLQEFHFIRSHFGTESVEAIGRALGSGALKKLIKLVLTGTRMNAGDMATFAKVFELSDRNVLPSLTHLDLSSNYFSEIGLQHLGEALKSGCLKELRDLHLSSTGMTAKGMETLAKGFRHGETSLVPNLETLDLFGNSFTEVGFQHLGEALKSGLLKKLRHLGLSGTGMTDKGMETLAKGFRHGETSLVPNLERLDLSHNSFTKVGLQHLAEALKPGILDSLKELGVYDCPKACSEEAANIFVSALQLNNQLTVDVNFEWHMFPAVLRLYRNLRGRNYRQMGIMAGLHNSPTVQAVFGKVYLCGSPEVGKTTLSNSFQKTFFKSLWTSARSSNDLRRTRGIDVSQFSNKGTKRWKFSKQKENPITLIVWDMAGQGDYHLVHHSFFPDLSFSQGKATTFLVVCTSRDLVESEEQLKYWLRYIASSCNKTTPNRRQVFVVLNRIGGQKVQGYPERWKHVLEGVTKDFKELLDIKKDLFFVDVRKRHNVQPIKKCLLHHSRKVLTNEKVPKLCQDMQESLPRWSEKNKKIAIDTVETFVRSDINILEEATREAVHLRILPTEVTEESGAVILHGSRVPTQPAILSLEGVACEESGVGSNWIGEASQPSGKMARTVSVFKGEILRALKEAESNVTTEVREARREVVDEVGKVAKKLNNVEKMLREGFTKVLNEQTKVLGKLQETQKFLIEVQDRTCPNLIYLAEIDSGRWANLKQALSPNVSVVLRFACEAMYGNYKPHKVQNQRGVDISALKPLIKKIAPWLKASLIVFLTSARIATNMVIPGLGMILPDMRQLRQASSLLAGIEWATDYAYDELNGLIREGFGLDPTDPLSNPRDVYGKSRAAITQLIENLTSDNYEDQFGLRKVTLLYRDRSFHGIVWICTECHRKFQKDHLISEVRK